jgi:hypothetical protein
MRIIYRADRVRAFFCVVLGCLTVASASQQIAAGGVHPAWIFLCFFAGIFIGVAVCILLTRVAVDDSGLRKRAPFAGGFRASWDDVESWWVNGGNADSLPHACFRFRGRPAYGVVYAADVCRPGFDKFLSGVRQCVGDRETAKPVDGFEKQGGASQTSTE